MFKHFAYFIQAQQTQYQGIWGGLESPSVQVFLYAQWQSNSAEDPPHLFGDIDIMK